MKTRLFYMLLFISSISFAQWQFEGTAKFTNNATDVAITTDANNTPYVAYSDITDGLLHVKKFDGTNWVDVGSNATGVVIPSMLSIEINPVTGHPWVAYRNKSTSRLDVVKYDGTSWSLEVASLGNFNPHSKIILKFSATGKAVIGASSKGSLITNASFALFSNRSGTWKREFVRQIFENCFDVISDTNFVVGWGYRFGNWRPRATRYKYDNGSWAITSNINYTPAGGVNAYMFTMAGTLNKILHHYNYQGGRGRATNRLEMVGGTRPSGANNPPKRTLFFDYNELDHKSYALYYSPNQDLVINQYDQYADTWTNLNIGLNFSGVDPKAKIISSKTGNKVYVAYLDNNKVSVKYYGVTAPIAQVYVDVDATGNNDGTSWANAYTNLQDAIDNTSLPTEIWVADGTYKPTKGTGNKATFTIEGTPTKIYGGFNGTETNFNQRDVKNNVTILSGDLNGDDTANINTTEATRADNSYHVISLKKSGKGTIIDGFTISGGNADGPTDNNCTTPANNQDIGSRGGAIISQPHSGGRISATIQNCIIENNSGAHTGVYAQFNPCGQRNIVADVDFKNCIIRNNYSDAKSAFLFFGANEFGQHSRGSLINSLLYNNTSKSSASCVRLGTSSRGTTASINVDIINSTFTNNTGNLGQVFSMERASNSTIKNSIIYGNGSIAPFNITTSGSKVSNSIVQGAQSGGLGSDPLFTDATNNDFTLQAGSPAINAGNNASLPSDILKDLAGNNRISGGTVDMGAYERAVTQRTLTITATNGNVATNPNPTNGTYDDGTSVELTATPDAGYQFDGWSGDATGTTNPLTITMDADKSVTAMFSQITYTLTLDAVTNGRIDASTLTGPAGTQIIITATPDQGYELDAWTDDATGQIGNSITVTLLNRNITVGATFSATASVNNEEFSKAVNVYPNPVHNTLFVKTNSFNEFKKLEVFNILGEKVLETSQNNVDVSQLAKGIYILKIKSTDDKIATKKFVKQ